MGPLGTFGRGEKWYLDAKASDITEGHPPRLWVKEVEQHQTEVIAFSLDCAGRKLKADSSVIYDKNEENTGGTQYGGGWTEVAPDTLGNNSGTASARQTL